MQSNFEDGVVEACGNYFLTDLDIQKTSKATDLKLSQLRAGSRYPGGIVTGMPVHVASDGVVHIKENLLGGTCEVSAYGIPVQATFDSIAARLISSGYIEDEQSTTPEKHFFRVFQRVSNDIAIVVTLTGNEAGASGTASRFSTLTGYVGFKDAE